MKPLSKVFNNQIKNFSHPARQATFPSKNTEVSPTKSDSSAVGPGFGVLQNPTFRQVLIDKLSVGRFNREDNARRDFSYWILQRNPHFNNIGLLFSQLRVDINRRKIEGETFRNFSFLCSYLEHCLGRLNVETYSKPAQTQLADSCVEALLFIEELASSDQTVYTSKVNRLLGRLRTLILAQRELLAPERIIEILELELQSKSVFFYFVGPLVESVVERSKQIKDYRLIPKILNAMTKNPILFGNYSKSQEDHPDAMKVVDSFSDLFVRSLQR